MEKLKVGDSVRIISECWDDHAERDWKGWIGQIEYIGEEPFDIISGVYPFFVLFPNAPDEWNHFDFAEDELEYVDSDKQLSLDI